MIIKYLKHSEIDKCKWDECIGKSNYGLIYSTTVYLDNMASDWDGLVMDEYAAVMPIPFRKKYGIYYVYPPAFSQQMGITSLQEITTEIIQLFIKSLPSKFRYVEMNFNVSNLFQSANEQKRNNYILSLLPSFKILENNFSRSALRNIRKANDQNISIKENVAFEEIIRIHRYRFKDEVGANADDYERLEKLFTALQKTNSIFTIGAYSCTGELIGGSIYFLYKKRITFIINGNTHESLKNGATHLLMYNSIKKYSGQDLILDFEGSDFLDFVRFYQQYGANAEIYNLIKINNLPWPLSLFKR